MGNDAFRDNQNTDLSSSSNCNPKKFIKLDVPDFDTSPTATEAQHSYLRIGATESTDPTASSAGGEDLAGLVTTFHDDARTRNAASGVEFAGSLTDESARLHSKGGWRDHTDGNRISTTRGDKVEVIGGNYRLLVLGRTTEGGHTWESSGGLLRDYDQTSYAVSQIEWVQKHGGTWMVKTEGSKGDYHSITDGYHEDHHTGDTKGTLIGDSDDTQTGKATSFHGGDTDSTTAGVTYRDISTHVNHHELSAYVDHQDLTAGVSALSLNAIAQSFSLMVGLLNTSIDICVSKSEVLIAADKQDIFLGATYIEVNTAEQMCLNALGKTELSTSQKVLAGIMAFI